MQRQGGPEEEIRSGDVFWVPPEVKHWHCATSTGAMSHVAITETLDGNRVTWMEHVSDTEYDGALPGKERAERLQFELVGGIDAERALFSGRRAQPEESVPDEEAPN